MTLWGIDLGGTKVEGAVIEMAPSAAGESLRVVARLRVPSGADQGYANVLEAIERIVVSLEEATGTSRPPVIGIGTPGAVVPATGLMKNCNSTCLNGQPLVADLAVRLGTDVRLANDADCFALAEALHGAGAGFPTVFGIIMGTGVGGGFVIDGKLLRGPNGLSGEWGHLTLEPSGPECYCGRKGCVETYLCGPAVERAHARRTGSALSLKEISVHSDSDPDCSETIFELCSNFGRALAQVVNVVDPSVIVLGGGAGQTPQLRTIGVEATRKHVFGPDFTTPLVPPKLGDSAGVFGAAFLARQDQLGTSS